MHLPVVQDRRKGHGCDALDEHKLGMTEVRVMFDGGFGSRLFKTKRLPEWSANILGRGDLSVMQAIFAANERSRRVVEELVGRSDSGGTCENGLSAIQAIFTANGRSGRVVEELVGRSVLIANLLGRIVVKALETNRGRAVNANPVVVVMVVGVAVNW